MLSAWSLPVAVGGGTAPGAAAAADRLAPDVDALLSFGLAGALDPALPPGTLLVPDRVVDAPDAPTGGDWPTDPRLSRTLGPAAAGTLLGGGAVLATVAAKRDARRRTGAVAVDLESAAVARAAARHGKPFAVLRAICDGATEPLPRAALAALDNVGRIGLLRVVLAVLRHPAELPALLALARHAALARRALLARVAAVRPA